MYVLDVFIHLSFCPCIQYCNFCNRFPATALHRRLTLVFGIRVDNDLLCRGIETRPSPFILPFLFFSVHAYCFFSFTRYFCCFVLFLF